MTLMFGVSLAPVKWLPRTPDNNEVIKIVIWRVFFVKSDDAGVELAIHDLFWKVINTIYISIYQISG